MLIKVTSIAVAAILVTATPSFAEGHGGHGGHWRGGGGNWVAPFVGGAVLGGALGAYGAYGYAPAPYYAPSPVQPYYRWDCNPYGQCGWVWR